MHLFSITKNELIIRSAVAVRIGTDSPALLPAPMKNQGHPSNLG